MVPIQIPLGNEWNLLTLNTNGTVHKLSTAIADSISQQQVNSSETTAHTY